VRLTIITVTLNSRYSIEDTINSVLSQSFENIEHIFIDGGSGDGTLEILESYKDKVATVVSGPDNGIYDAMNKGILLATGDVIGILNADDVYATKDTLALVANAFLDPRIDACYGDLVYVCPKEPDQIKRDWKAGSYEERKLYFGWMPPHPTFFVRRTCYTKFGLYRTDLGSSADYELMLRYLLCHKIRLAYIPEVLVRMHTGGTSNASIGNRLNAHLMDWRAWQVNGLHPYPWTLPFKPLRKITQWLSRS
jgi:glycosyltransferase